MTPEARDTQGDRAALAELLIREGAAPGDSVHSWRCEYPDVYGPCDCVEQLADEILASDWLAAHVARARAEAIDDVAREWQFGGWTTLINPVPAHANRVIALGQRVTDWLRDRADHIDPGADQ